MQIYLPENIKPRQFTKANLGGKACHLLEMQQAGFSVPPFFMIPSSTVEELLKPVRGDIEFLCLRLSADVKPDIAFIAEAIRQKVLSIKLPGNFLQKIREICREYLGAGDFVAIRSSAPAEDGSRVSFAGQHESFLYVEPEQLGSKILETIASAWNVGALSYRLAHGLPVRFIQYALVIQKMVKAERSGVLFSMNINGNMADMLVVAGYGLGEGIVSDRVQTDTCIVNRQNLSVDWKTAHKLTALVYRPGAGIVEQAVEVPLQDQEVLSEKEIFEICDYAREAEKLLGSAVDMEFSYDEKGQLFILQMRRITTVDIEKVSILDNTNIVESYPGITLPLTFSFAVSAYEKVFKGSSRAFWISGKVIEKHEEIFKNLIAHFHGRIYYRLDNWYRMMGMVHSSRHSVKAWEKAVGLMQSESHKVSFSLRKKIRALMSSGWLLVNFRRGNKRFFRAFKENYALLKDYRKHLHSPAALWEHYESVTRRMFGPWHLTLVNDFIAFKAFGWLQGFVKKYGLSENEALANDLLCGMGGVESERAVLKTLELKEKILADPALKDLFCRPEKEILEFGALGKFPAFFETVRIHLETYGDRTLSELKLETPSLRKSPETFIRLLKMQMTSPLTAADFQKKQDAIRLEAKTIAGKKLKAWMPRTWLFSGVRKLAAYGLKNRENMRFSRTRAYGAVKEIFLEVGKMMTEAGHLLVPEDIFYLKIEDLRHFCEGKSGDDYLNKVEKAKERYEAYKNIFLPDRIIFQGDEVPCFGQTPPFEAAGSGVYQGIAVSRGTVRAPAVVLSEPDLDCDVRGSILVSKMTDPGWVFLMTRAAGLISERGSLLSHTAIVGRELGIPVVVGIPGATRMFKTGDLLHLDGNAGTVEMLSGGSE